MPTYEYECTHCGHKFEIFQNINDKHLSVCPKCNKKLKRLIGAGAGIIFKEPRREKTEPSACPAAREGCKGCHQIPR